MVPRRAELVTRGSLTGTWRLGPLVRGWAGLLVGVVLLLGAPHSATVGSQLGLALPGAVFAAVGLTRVPTLQTWDRRGRRGARLRLDPTGIEVDGLRVPWSVVEEVVTVRRRGDLVNAVLMVDDPWQWLAVRVGDFDNVLGLPPVRAGLANLTRRRLVLLVEVSEVAYPRALHDGLVHVLEHPETRASLATAEGVRLLTRGPAGPVTAAP